jgi:hypothetical protein
MLKLACILLCAAQLVGSAINCSGAEHLVFRDTPKDNLTLRLWLWQHWSSRRVCAATQSWTWQGDSGTTNYTIAKDRAGAFSLSVHLHSSKWGDLRMIALSVRRIHPPWFYDRPGKLIRHSRELFPDKFGLELKDKQGKILTHI